jgi:hypothetical protein
MFAPLAVLFAPSAMAVCGYCVTPSVCDTLPSRYNCAVILNLGGDYCKLTYSVICGVGNPTRMADEKRAPQVEVSESGVMQAVAIWRPTEQLPIQFNFSAQNYATIAATNPRAALALLLVMDEGKSDEAASMAITFYSRPVDTRVALEAWTAKQTNSPLVVGSGDEREIIQVQYDRHLDVRGNLTLDITIVAKTEQQVEKSRSLFSAKLTPLYSVHPTRPVYSLTSWSTGLSRPATVEQ